MDDLYVIRGDTLRGIADEIRLKNNSSAKIKGSKIREQIHRIESDGGGDGSVLWWQYPGTPELIGDVTKTVNFAADTIWNSITPSSSSQTILAAQNKEADRFTYAFDFNNNDYVVICESFLDVHYTAEPLKPALAGASNVFMARFGFINGESSFTLTSTLARSAIFSKSGSTAISAQTSYGITCGIATPGLPNNYATPSYMILGRNAVIVRADDYSYVTVDSLKAIDAAATNIYYRWRIYRMRKNTPSAVADRIVHMAINHSFMDD